MRSSKLEILLNLRLLLTNLSLSLSLSLKKFGVRSAEFGVGNTAEFLTTAIFLSLSLSLSLKKFGVGSPEFGVGSAEFEVRNNAEFKITANQP